MDKDKIVKMSERSLKRKIKRETKKYIKDITSWIKSSAKGGNNDLIWTNWGISSPAAIPNIYRNKIKEHFEAIGFEVDFNIEHTIVTISWEASKK